MYKISLASANSIFNEGALKMNKRIKALIATIIIATLVVLPSYKVNSPTLKVGITTQGGRNGSGDILIY